MIRLPQAGKAATNLTDGFLPLRSRTFCCSTIAAIALIAVGEPAGEYPARIDRAILVPCVVIYSTADTRAHETDRQRDGHFSNRFSTTSTWNLIDSSTIRLFVSSFFEFFRVFFRVFISKGKYEMVLTFRKVLVMIATSIFMR